MNPISDYNVGKARHQDFEAEVSRYASSDSNVDRHSHRLSDQLAKINPSTAITIVAIVSITASITLGL
ncbi:MAG: hypothetical protein AAF629_17300 [Chloroflexota bacterium]